jgi:hypothetical protein
LDGQAHPLFDRQQISRRGGDLTAADASSGAAAIITAADQPGG